MLKMPSEGPTHQIEQLPDRIMLCHVMETGSTSILSGFRAVRAEIDVGF